jgi:predicted GNAT family acetyltransferase
MLNTDLSNLTSNAIYQSIGYRRVGEADELRFLSRTEALG